MIVTKAKYFILFFWALFSISCVTTRSLWIEIAEPGEKELPSEIQSLLLVNRTLDGNYHDLKADSLQRIFYKRQFNLDTVIYDIQSVDTTMKALGELLYESGRYDVVIPENRFLEFQKNSFLSLEMPWDEVKQLCETFNTDAVVSLDHFKTRVETGFSDETFFNPGTGEYFSGYKAAMQVSYEVLFRVYDPVQEKVWLREFLRDTLVWEDADYTTRALFSRFTPVKTALTEAGIAIALDFTDKISTVWRQENRKYFNKGNPEFIQAGQFASAGDWENALKLWENTEATSGSKSLKSKAQLNMAVAYEMLGDIDQAIAWGLKSYETMYRPLTYEYLEILKKRKKEIQKNAP